MKKKIIITTIIILMVIAIVFTLIINLKKKDKVIYYNYSYTDAFIPVKETILIYNNGIIEKRYTSSQSEKNKEKKLSASDFNLIIDAIKKVEQCNLEELNSEEYSKRKKTVQIGSSYAIVYIDMNKKISIKDREKIYYSDETEELNEIINNIEQKYFKED